MVKPNFDVPAEEFEPQAAPAGPNLFQMAWRRKSLLALGLVAGLLLGGVYYSQRPIVYQSAAQVMVIKKRADPVPLQGLNGGTGLYDDYAAAHAVLLRSPVIVERAVKEHNLQDLPSFAGQGNPSGQIMGNLSVSVAQGGGANPILSLTYRGAASEDCRAVLNAVIHTYENFLEETYQNVNKESAGLIKKATELLLTDLKELKKKQQALRETAPVLIHNKEGVTAQQERLAGIDARRSALLLSQAEIKSRIAKIQEAIDQHKDPTPWLDAPLDSAKPLTARAEGAAALDSQLLALELQEQDLAETMGEDHPDLRTVRKRLERLRALQAGLNKDEEANGSSARHKTPASPAAVREALASLQQRLDSSDAELKSFDALYNEELKEVKKTSTFADQEEDLRKQIADSQQMYDSLMKPLQQIDLIKDYNGYNAQTIAPPTAGWKVEPNPYTVFPMAGFLGLAVGGLLGWLAEASDKSFRSPQEIRRRLGLPILGHVPEFDVKAVKAPENAALASSLCSVHSAKSPAAEAFRGVRTALYFSTQGQGHKVIQITSPTMGDGKSTLAANLAVSIAHSGKRVLIIDADFRRPRQHRLFNVSTQRGLASLIAEEAEPEDIVLNTAVPNLSILPCGPRPNNPAELLTSPRFAELLGLFRERYDFVIVDTPPLLAVSDPMVVAPRVDAVMLTMRLTNNGRPNAERAKEMLATIGANVLGVVVNGFGSKKGLAGYGGEGYGYQYAYAGGYYQDGDDSGVNVDGSKASDHSEDDDANSAVDLGASPRSSRRPAPARARKNSPVSWLSRMWGA